MTPRAMSAIGALAESGHRGVADLALARMKRASASSVTGLVVKGDQRGREIGFPTANLLIPTDGLGHGDGVYAATYSGCQLAEYPAAVSIGRRPTFYEHGVRLVEAHLLDFSGDLYGDLATVRLVEFIRPQRRFDGVEALIHQLQRDVARIRDTFAGCAPRGHHPLPVAGLRVPSRGLDQQMPPS